MMLIASIKIWEFEAPSCSDDISGHERYGVRSYCLSIIVSDKYERIRKVGEGTYAVVYESLCKETKRKVAIKRIKMTSQGFGLDISAIRELEFLRELHHPNIVDLQDVFIEDKNLNLVLGFYEVDLEMVIKDRSLILRPGDVKMWMIMLLRGLEHCHQRNIIHRDIKPNNLLLSPDGQLKLADFGLTRSMGYQMHPMTSQVVTRWYRAPELLFGAKFYTSAVDVWAAGCIFAELMLRTPFLVADTDMGQITTMFRALGTPTDSQWPGLKLLPDYVAFPSYPRPPLNTIFNAASSDALDLLERMLTYDPERRISARDALMHPYFKNAPRPTTPIELPRTDPEKFQQLKRTAEQAQFHGSGIQPKKLNFEQD